MTQEGNILIAAKGKEIYNLSRPQVYGKRVKLADGDKASNWGERDKTIIEHEEDLEQPYIKRAVSKKPSWIVRLINKIKTWLGL